MSKAGRRTRRKRALQPQRVDPGAAFADFIRRRLTGQQIPRGFYGPVDDEFVAGLYRRQSRGV